ncbi:lipocalin family protein [Microbulbifer bruguierae]|uniref:Outer membrane lipoprotein Blc n=1 Tax=Microbulbifer bruguierae TaxID=3029061 RepID=A0ABY8NAF0_9GAMM|nr:lipocalin family protein [Microbulbifer bruguierae]
MLHNRFLKTLLLLFTGVLAACTGIPEGVKPIDDFELPRYLGKWYEIARLDHSFERGLSRVTAEYSLRDDGGVKVVNRGFDAEHASWKESVGKAYFIGTPDVGHLKVSFFGPFYGSYVIFELDKDYRYAMVSGPNRSYLWLLSRTPAVDESVKKRFLQRADELGFDTGALIFVEQSPLDTD